MTATLDLKTDRMIFTDATLGSLKGVRLNNGYLEAVDYTLSSIGVLNDLTFGLEAALPASSKFGLRYFATDTNDLWFDDGTDWHIPKGGYTSQCKGYKLSGNQDVVTGAANKVVLTHEQYDGLNELDITTNSRFTAEDDGKYNIFASVKFAEALQAGNDVEITVRKNGSLQLSGNTLEMAATLPPGLVLAGSLELVATDYLELFISHNYGSNREILAGQRYTYLSINRIG